MTILTTKRIKKMVLLRRLDTIDPPLVGEKGYTEEVIAIPAPEPSFIEPEQKLSVRCRSLIFLLMVMLVLSTGGLVWGFVVCRVMDRPQAQSSRFQGWCAIPYEGYSEPKPMEPQFHIMNLPDGGNFPEVDNLNNGVIPKADVRGLATALQNMFQERIEIDKNFERIVAKDSKDGRDTNIVHDFDFNVSSIITRDRCFVMQLDRDSVIPPDMFVMSIKERSNMDLSVLHNTMRALLPPLLGLTGFGNYVERECASLPTYKLIKNNKIIRKRSAELPDEAKFSHFSGKHVQEIDVSNINMILAYEKNILKK